MSKIELPKAYESKQYEDAMYAAWEKSGFFNPDALPGDRREPFTITLPPPNVTGTLHLGHAVMLAIEDTLVRFARMRGKRALWVPGTDHAAIATQSKVERLLWEQEKKTRHDLGREEFLKRVERFAQESRDTIVNQMKKMGASLDWSREAFTLDEKRNRAVRTAFKKMYDTGLIYRGARIVNWDPKLQTTVSDDEVEWKEEQASFYYFKYGPFEIGTARPETKFGDKYVVVHPNDDRYKQYQHGQKLEVEWINGRITATVIKDKVVDMSFGTGAMTITPWHDATDFDIAQRHELDKQQIIDFAGKLLPVAGEFVGQEIVEARAKIVEKLKAKELLVRVDETYVHRLATNSRGGGVIEPQIKEQWFVDVNRPFWRGLRRMTLKKLMQEAVQSGKVKILPERFEKIYFHWIDNLRDWCISRQLWYGHRVPVWYREGEQRAPAFAEASAGRHGAQREIYVGIEPPQGDGWEQDPDTLDTWFSSGLWTFSTLGWPDKTSDLKMYHPTSVLETGYDIIFFWVARMILMSTYLLGEVPFRTVYLHGLVRDEQGRKMSKTLDNIIDPLDMTRAYGADATRLALMIGGAPGQDMKLSVQKIEGYRNFTNKLWNIARFVLGQIDSSIPPLFQGGARGGSEATLADAWIIGRLHLVVARVTTHLEKYELSPAGELLRDFTWGEFADWYVEIAKVQKRNGKNETTDGVLLYVLETLLKLWHPFMPFVTEAIWKEMGKEKFLMVEEWPAVVPPLTSAEGGSASGGKGGQRGGSEAIVEKFGSIQGIITSIRNLRSLYHVEPTATLEATVAGDDIEALATEFETIKALARLSALRFEKSSAKPDGAVSAVVGNATIHLILAGVVDLEKERARLQKELEETCAYVTSVDHKLADKEFLRKAPAHVVDQMRSKRGDAIRKVAALEQNH